LPRDRIITALERITENEEAMSAIIEDISKETAEAPAAQAKARGLSVDDYLKKLLGVAQPGSPVSTVEEFETDMNALAEKNLPPLPENFSREDIYFEHD
jgi:hypothetical protein